MSAYVSICAFVSLSACMCVSVRLLCTWLPNPQTAVVFAWLDRSSDPGFCEDVPPLYTPPDTLWLPPRWAQSTALGADALRR